MFTDRIEGKWINLFAALFEQSGVRTGDEVAILSETQSRNLNVHLSELALVQIGARPAHVVVTTPPQTAPVPIRSTGASASLQTHGPVMAALSFGGLTLPSGIAERAANRQSRIQSKAISRLKCV